MLRNIWRLRFAALVVLAIIIIYSYITSKTSNSKSSNANEKVFLWCTFSRVKDYDTRFKTKFSNFVTSLKQYSDVAVSLNVIVDDDSENIAKQILENVFGNSTTAEHDNQIEVFYHSINPIAMEMCHFNFSLYSSRYFTIASTLLLCSWKT
uniref:Uncharacterized protein n=1 Tax=Cacopsylla melanoneura TaxID=428564 RepID=A0A8D9E1X5_9HEMI